MDHPTLNSDRFRRWVSDVPDDKKERGVQLTHAQRVVRAFLGGTSPYRGLLLYHALGAGKTCAAISIAQSAARHGTGRKIVVVLAAALEPNFHKEILSCGGYDPRFSQWTNRDGEWIPSDDGETYDSLAPDEQILVLRHVTSKISELYSFVHFNGLTKSKLREMSRPGKNPFDGNIVIVDEVHNITKSTVRGNSDVNGTLFRLIMNARGAKVVALSGTPMVNEPAEIGFLISMIKGVQIRYRVSVPPNLYKVLSQVRAHACVERAGLDTATDTMWVEMVPEGYQLNVSRDAYVVRDASDDNDSVVRTLLGDDMTRLNVLPFELDSDKFNAKYIKGGELSNERDFLQRAYGVVSYYAPDTANVYPDISAYTVHWCPMSEEQTRAYVVARQKEIMMERRRTTDDVSVYRSFSRRICNFVFPAAIKRMFKNDMKALGLMSDDAAYKRHLDDVMHRLIESDNWLRQDLHRYAPKCIELLRRLKEMPELGTALIYSEFRDVPEGLQVVKAVLDCNGYEEFDINKPPSPGKQRYMFLDMKRRNPSMQQLLGVFNNDWDAVDATTRKLIERSYEHTDNLHGDICRVLLISGSGAEGISLKNVRQVHVFEPYWQRARIQQVVGRARRAYSHAQLPPAERNIAVDIYAATFASDSKTTLPDDIRKHDTDDGSRQPLTSDQHLLSVSMKKSRLIDVFASLLRRAAIDCGVYDSGTDGCFDHARG
jgi:hypothetical protein